MEMLEGFMAKILAAGSWCAAAGFPGRCSGLRQELVEQPLRVRSKSIWRVDGQMRCGRRALQRELQERAALSLVHDDLLEVWQCFGTVLKLQRSAIELVGQKPAGGDLSDPGQPLFQCARWQ
ncbi:hypothetical protein ACVNIS_08345 [Sphaerotilaceae bacterium SBD11-9]